MNIKEIAKLAGVSASTVSKIMNQKDESISADTRERVLKIVREYNYIPYASATTGNQKNWTLGILLRSSVSFDAALEGMIQAAQINGYITIVCNSYQETEQELKNITALCSKNVDGIIWEPVSEKSISSAAYIREKEIPYLTIGPDGGKDSHLLPYELFAWHITQELIARRHTHIACLLTEGRRKEAFLAGYKKCLFDNQMPLDDNLIYDQLNDSLVSKVSDHQVTAIISSHYRKSLEFSHLMRSLHYQIPEDISLISLKNDKTEALSLPEISTYTVDNAGFGSFLCRKLIAQIEKSADSAAQFTHDYQLDNEASISIPFNLNIPKITVVGSINIDTYLNMPALPDTGKTVSTTTSSVYPGGKGINQAIGASKLGHHVALIGNVGSDLDSNLIYQALNTHGVDTFGVKRCHNTDTGKAYIFVEASGNSMISILAGANSTFTPADILEKESLFANTGYCLIQSEIPIETVIQACQTAHKYHAETILKPSACRHFPAELLGEIDILIPNEEELQVLCPGDQTLEEKANSLLGHGIKSVIVTLGSRGCYVKTANWAEYFPAVNFTAIDNTGASDAFISALASYLLYGYDLKKAIHVAAYAAGFCISRDGVVPALIDKVSLETYINQKEPGFLK